MKWLVDAMDPTRKQRAAAEKKAKLLLKSLGIDRRNLTLTEHELMIASQLVRPADIDVRWDHIAGLDDVIQELRETVILPIQKRELFANTRLTQAPKGVLVHGPPGCGKTMIAKATAREAGAHFINLDVSSITDKWYGESNKLAAAVFSLAIKIQPCIIFIDEIDSLLRSRSNQDHEATAMIKAQFMQLWDGLATDSSCVVVVMGATNRPKDVDRAILRRMPATFHVGLPNIHQRRAILTRILAMEDVGDDVDYARVSELTKNFSGSDLRELCRTASVYRVRDYMQTHVDDESSDNDDKSDGDKDEPISGCKNEPISGHKKLREISNDDLLKAIAKMKESKVHCGELASDAYTNVDLD